MYLCNCYGNRSKGNHNNFKAVIYDADVQGNQVKDLNCSCSCNPHYGANIRKPLT